MAREPDRWVSGASENGLGVKSQNAFNAIGLTHFTSFTGITGDDERLLAPFICFHSKICRTIARRVIQANGSLIAMRVVIDDFGLNKPRVLIVIGDHEKIPPIW